MSIKETVELQKLLAWQARAQKQIEDLEATVKILAELQDEPRQESDSGKGQRRSR